MDTKNTIRLVVAGAFLAMIGSAQAAGDPAAGKFKFSTCMGCHAIPGYTNAYPTYHVPRLGGQHAPYIVAALKEYQAGNRAHPTMQANAASLSEQDMEDIAAYVATAYEPDGGHTVSGNVAAGKKKAAPCAACHGQDGNNTDPNFPRLAGQHEDYLHKALQDYKSGARKNAIMNGMAAPLSEQDMVDLAAYFASQKKGLGVVKQP